MEEGVQKGLQQGLQKGWALSTQRLMEKQGFSFSEACDTLEVPPEERPEVEKPLLS